MAPEMHMECSECGGNMELDKQQVMLICPYCGNREPLDEITAARLNKKDEVAVALKQLEHEEQTRKRVNETGSKALKGIKRAVLILVGIFVALIIASVALEAIDDASYERERAQRMNSEYTWPMAGLATLVDKPASDTGYIEYNSATTFEIEVPGGSDDFVTYVASCKQRGFVIDERSAGESYGAYDAAGNHVSVTRWTYNDTIEISVDAPMVASQVYWPTTGVASRIPAPQPSTDSTTIMGVIDYDSGTSFRAKVIDMTPEAYAAYVTSCMEAGFDKNYSRHTNDFYADNEDGAHLSLEYLGYNTVEIRVYER